MWPESFSVSSKYHNSREIEFFLGVYFFGAPCRRGTACVYNLYLFIYLFIYYIIVHEVQNTHIQRKIGLKNIKSNHKITIDIVKQLVI